MTRLGPVVLALVLLAGCGVQPSGVQDGPAAPTGVAPGVTLYFLGAGDRLVPQVRETNRLGTVAEALSLLLQGPGESGLHTGITPAPIILVEVTTTGSAIELRVPLSISDVTRAGIDQIVCTALGNHVQSGGSTATTVVVHFTLPTAASEAPRTCPVIRSGR